MMESGSISIDRVHVQSLVLKETKMLMVLPLLLFPLVATAQRLPTPGIAFILELEDAQAEGVAQDSAGNVYVTANHKFVDTGGGFFFSQSYVHRVDGNTGAVVQSQRLWGQDRAKVGACVLLSDESMLIINPGPTDSAFNEGIMAVRTDTLDTAWTNNVVRESDKGIPPLIVDTPREYIIYYSSTGGIVAFDRDGVTLWALTNVKTGRIEVSNSFVYAVDQQEALGYPLEVYSLSSGEFRGTSGIHEGAATNAGVVLSPNGEYAYTVRSGVNGGLYRTRANFVFVPPDMLTSDISAGHRFGPLISPDGDTLYVINTLEVVIEAYSLSQQKTLWRSTQCNTIPPLLSRDGSAMYSFDCSGALVRLDTATSDTLWRLADLPVGFTPCSMTLVENDSRLLLAGQVYDQRKGYVFSLYTDDATIAPTAAPSITPQPTLVEPLTGVPPAPSHSPSTPDARIPSPTLVFTAAPSNIVARDVSGSLNCAGSFYSWAIIGAVLATSLLW